MKSIKLLKKRLKACDVEFTDDINNALWLLGDGSMIDGEFYSGMRRQDHRIIECGIKYNRYDGNLFWDEIHLNYGGIRLCPESKIALIRVKQNLTDYQKQILKHTFYKIERY